MKRHRVPFIALATIGIALGARAEVAVHTIGQGQFKSFRNTLHVSEGRPVHWQRVTGPAEDAYLNTDGDNRGDHVPKAMLLPAGKLQTDPSPLVVWSRLDSNALGIYWSVWSSSGGWSPPKRLSSPSTNDQIGVRLFLDPHGDLHLVWYTSGDHPAVYYSKFSGGGWATPALLSAAQGDSRNPTIELSKDSQLVITWEDWTQKPVRIQSFLSEHFDP